MGRREQVGQRLRRVEGQIRGLQRMVEEERECEAILTQLIAARAALDRVGLLVVENYVEECLPTQDPDLMQQRVKRVLGMVFSHYSLAGPADEARRTAVDSLPEEE